MRDNIHFSESMSKRIIPYIEESLSILESLDLTVTEDVTFYTCRITRKGWLGYSQHRYDDSYSVCINKSILDDKDECTNTIIHELLHVKSKNTGDNMGHGRWWNRLANYVSAHSKYNISRYARVNPTIKEPNSFFNLSKEKQKKLYEKMKEENNSELLDKFYSIYFSLIDVNLKDDYTFYFIENRILKSKDFAYLSFNELFPFTAVNDRVRWGLVNRYLIGKYDDILDTPSKAIRFHYLFKLRFNGDDPENRKELLKMHSPFDIVARHTELRFPS